LSEYSFDIVYKSGKQNGNADALSRIKINALDKDDDISMQANIDKDENRVIYIEQLTKELKKLGKERKIMRNKAMSISDSESEKPIVISDSDTEEARSHILYLHRLALL
jgi:reverse gyrase